MSTQMNATTDLPRCSQCIEHPGWAHGDLSHRNEPADVCRACLGSGVDQAAEAARRACKHCGAAGHYAGEPFDNTMSLPGSTTTGGF